MVRHTPPMGWNSWNTFAENVNEKVVRESAEAMVQSGLYEAGYEYVVIDDCWSEKVRGKDGKLREDKRKFPSGMKELCDYVHGLGLKIGIYSCAGPLTCAGYPGSFDHEFVDAKSFADWGFDFLKYDYCYKPASVQGKFLYRRMGTALASCGRDILFSACSWGADETHTWIDGTGAHMWRSTGDIWDNYASIRDIIKLQYKILPYGGVGCFNDMDMLVTGMRGKGHVGIGGCTYEEYKLHMSVWAILASPLMIGCDIRSLNDETRELLTNRGMLSINQDARGCRAYIANEEEVRMSDVSPVFVRSLEGGDIAVCFTNLGDTDARGVLQAAQMGLSYGCGKKLCFCDVWSGEQIAMTNECLCLDMPPHTARLFRVKLK